MIVSKAEMKNLMHQNPVYFKYRISACSQLYAPIKSVRLHNFIKSKS